MLNGACNDSDNVPTDCSLLVAANRRAPERIRGGVVCGLPS